MILLVMIKSVEGVSVMWSNGETASRLLDIFKRAQLEFLWVCVANYGKAVGCYAGWICRDTIL